MSEPQFVSTGLEPEFLTTRLYKVESAGPGLVRLYWSADRDGMMVCSYTQIVPLALLPSLREAMLFTPPDEPSTNPGHRAALN